MPHKRRILIVRPIPVGTLPLSLDEEVREIQAGLRRTGGRSKFEIRQAWAVRPRDVRRALLDYQPEFVHFCGRGKGDEGLVLENEAGNAHIASTEALSGLFELFSEQVKCVVLNACYSERQARAIAQHVEAVVGMQRAIGDRSAVEFAIGFYDAVAASRTPTEAFRFGAVAAKTLPTFDCDFRLPLADFRLQLSDFALAKFLFSSTSANSRMKMSNLAQRSGGLSTTSPKNDDHIA